MNTTGKPLVQCAEEQMDKMQTNTEIVQQNQGTAQTTSDTQTLLLFGACVRNFWPDLPDILWSAYVKEATLSSKYVGMTPHGKKIHISPCWLTVALSRTLMGYGPATLCFLRACSNSWRGGWSHFPNTTRSMSLRENQKHCLRFFSSIPSSHIICWCTGQTIYWNVTLWQCGFVCLRVGKLIKNGVEICTEWEF